MEPSVVEALGLWDDTAQESRLRRHWHPDRLLFVEDAERGRIGTISVHAAHPAGLFLEQFYVLPAGRGTGFLLMARLGALATTHGVSLCLKVLKTSPAIRLYVMAGFSVEDEDEHQLHMVRAPRGDGCIRSAA
jgi:GNAT superfamily N-acetyltransferase